MSLGDGIKKIEENESETVLIQRRAIRANKELKSGQKLSKDDLIFLRPCPSDGLSPDQEEILIGKIINRNIPKGDIVKIDDLSSDD